MAPERKTSTQQSSVEEEDMYEQSTEGGSEKKKAKAWTSQEDLVILNYFDSIKKIPDIQRLLPDRPGISVRKRVAWILNKTKDMAGKW